MRKIRFNEEKIIRILDRVEAGELDRDVVRDVGICEQTFYRWRTKFGGMGVSEARRLKELEVENALYDHPAVLEAAVIGVPDERPGESITAVVVLGSGVSCGADELVRNCRDRLAHYKCPNTVEFIEAMPRTGSGKISKMALRVRCAREPSGHQ